MKRKVILFSIIVLIGIAGYFIFRDNWIEYVFAHIGAIGILGLFACLTEVIANRKGLNQKRAFLISFVPSILLGIAAVYLVDGISGNVFPSCCGGVVSLGIAIIVLIVYLILRKSQD